MGGIVSLYCNKGGVSKTTTTFNLGWKLAELGKKVILVDADSQCNLTGMMLQFNDISDVGSYYDKKGNVDIYSEVEGYLFGNESNPQLKAIPVEKCPGKLWLVPGNIKLSEIESQIVLGFKTSTGIPRLAQVPGLYPKLIRELYANEEADFVLVDTAPSITGLNESLVMGSDFFIVPTSPDYYSGQALLSMAKFLPEWLEETEKFRNGKAAESVGKYKFPSKKPQFLGYIVQNYRPRKGRVARAFQEWIDKIERQVKETLVPKLRSEGLCQNDDRDFLLGKFSDFNSLIAISQECAKPVFALSDEELKSHGHILTKQKEKIEEFNQQFDDLAKQVIALTRQES